MSFMPDQLPTSMRGVVDPSRPAEITVLHDRHLGDSFDRLGDPGNSNQKILDKARNSSQVRSRSAQESLNSE
jgi:hypothetical protein